VPTNTSRPDPASEGSTAPLIGDGGALRLRATINADAYGGTLTSFYRGMTCENVTIKGDQGTPITAYVAIRCAGLALRAGSDAEAPGRFQHHYRSKSATAKFDRLRDIAAR